MFGVKTTVSPTKYVVGYVKVFINSEFAWTVVVVPNIFISYTIRMILKN